MIRAATLAEIGHYASVTGYTSNDMGGMVDTTAGGDLVAFAGFDHWMPGSCRMHVLVPESRPRPVAPSFVPEVFTYLFKKVRLHVVIAELPASHERTRNLAKKLGFRDRASIPHGWDHHDDLFIMTMSRAECRWLSETP